MFKLIDSVRNLIPRLGKKEDPGFTCSVYDIANDKVILNTHDIDEFLKFMDEFWEQEEEQEEPGVKEESGECDTGCGCCRECDYDCAACDCDDGEDEAEDEYDSLQWTTPETVHVVRIPTKSIIAVGYLLTCIACLIAAAKKK